MPWPSTPVAWAQYLREQAERERRQRSALTAPLLPSPVEPPGSQLSRALGVKGGQLIGGVDAVPVAVLADYSGRLANEALEPRGWAGAFMGAAPATFRAIALPAKAAGGMVIESALLKLATPGLTGVWLLYRTPAPVIAGAVNNATLAVGGAPLSAPQHLVAAIAAVPPNANGFTPALSELTALRWWIPPGWWFTAVANTANTDAAVGVLFRELPDGIPGASA